MMKTLISFLAACILFLAVVTPRLSAQIENLPWGVKRIRGDVPWDGDRDLIVDFESRAGKGICVAVVDTGIWRDHPDLRGRVVDGKSYGIGEYWEDYIGHGTHIAGTIAAVDDGNHLIGVAPNCSLYAVKVTDETIIDGINWAANKGAHIISISLGHYEEEVTPEYLNQLEEACNNAYNNGALLIAASGNDNRVVKYPAAFDSVIAVGAVDQNDYKPWFSNWGLELELAAPGVDINSTWPRSPYYQVIDGTSFAVSHVTGTAALIFGSKVDAEYDSNSNGQWDNFEVRQKLRDTVLDIIHDDDLGGPGKDGYYGYGLVNAWYSNQRPPGDICLYDYLVDIFDVSYVCKYYSKKLGDPNWWMARVADITINNEVDTYDLYIVGRHYGQVDP